MLVPQRRQRILEEIHERGVANVDELSNLLGVSASTVRRDLADLAFNGLLIRAHGGAYLNSEASAPPLLRQLPPGRLAEDPDARRRIGAAAAEHLVDGQTIMILGGSTTSMLLPHLASRTLTVVTNGIDIVAGLARYPAIDVVVLGGVLHREQMTLLGPLTDRNMADLHVDVLFAGAYGIDPDLGVTGSKVALAGNHHSMLRHVDALIVMAEGKKFGRQGSTLLASIEQVQTFLTDPQAPAAVVAALREQGARVTIC